MTTPDDLLRAILANPGDDNLRLVFADKLDDCGEAEHAEFVRTSIAGGTRPIISAAQFREWFVPFWSNIPDASFSMKRNAGGSVVAVWRDANGYGGGVRRGPEPRRVIVRRGFVAEVRLSCQDWLAHGPAIARRQPIERVVLTDKQPGRMWGHDTGNESNYRRWWDALHSDANRHMDADVLPDCIFRCIVFPFKSGYHFPTESDALDALSTAAIAWARQTEPAPVSA